MFNDSWGLSGDWGWTGHLKFTWELVTNADFLLTPIRILIRRVWVTWEPGFLPSLCYASHVLPLHLDISWSQDIVGPKLLNALVLLQDVCKGIEGGGNLKNK